ncbi:hypothetical protein HAX54_038868 [Datura stramonium]|uniref:DUF4283 domain-containing protein n=1 Tax=Datura stramonium TaxID=4076 RepID=A0ABS8SIG4_DATST|nr:hypothetical protein [Datura stramonium]
MVVAEDSTASSDGGGVVVEEEAAMTLDIIIMIEATVVIVVDSDGCDDKDGWRLVDNGGGGWIESPSVLEADCVLREGERWMDGNLLRIYRRSEEIHVNVQRRVGTSVINVTGLPLHLWCNDLFKNVGEECGDFLEPDYSLMDISTVRILVSKRGRVLVYMVVEGREEKFKTGRFTKSRGKTRPEAIRRGPLPLSTELSRKGAIKSPLGVTESFAEHATQNFDTVKADSGGKFAGGARNLCREATETSNLANKGNGDFRGQVYGATNALTHKDGRGRNDSRQGRMWGLVLMMEGKNFPSQSLISLLNLPK